MSDGGKSKYMTPQEQEFWKRIQTTKFPYDRNSWINENDFWQPNKMLSLYRQIIEFFNKKGMNVYCVDENGIMHFSIIEQALIFYIISTYSGALNVKPKNIDEILESIAYGMRNIAYESKEYRAIMKDLEFNNLKNNIRAFAMNIIRQYYRHEFEEYKYEGQVQNMTKLEKLIAPHVPSGRNNWLDIIKRENLENMMHSLIKLGVDKNEVLSLIGEIVAQSQIYKPKGNGNQLTNDGSDGR